MGGGIITKNSKTKLLSILFFALISINTLYAQQETNVDNLQLENQVTAQQLESEMVLMDSQSQAETQNTSSTSMLFFRMLLVLILVVACIYAVFHFVKKSTGSTDSSDPYIKKVASLTLVPGKSVQVITIQDHCYVLGVSDSSVDLISELNDKELIDAMNINADSKPTGKPRDFATMLATAMGLKKKDNNQTIMTSSLNLKHQSDRLRNASVVKNEGEDEK